MSGSHPWGQALLNSVELLGDRRRRQVWQKFRLAIFQRRVAQGTFAKEELPYAEAQQSLAAGGAIACFSSSLVPSA